MCKSRTFVFTRQSCRSRSYLITGTVLLLHSPAGGKYIFLLGSAFGIVTVILTVTYLRILFLGGIATGAASRQVHRQVLPGALPGGIPNI